MEITITKTNGGYKVNCVLKIKPVDGDEEFTLTASYPLNQGDLMSLLTDESQSRQVAVHIVGRLLTTWKFGLIKVVSEAVSEAAALTLAGRVRGGGAAGEQ